MGLVYQQVGALGHVDCVVHVECLWLWLWLDVLDAEIFGGSLNNSDLVVLLVWRSQRRVLVGGGGVVVVDVLLNNVGRLLALGGLVNGDRDVSEGVGVLRGLA